MFQIKNLGKLDDAINNNPDFIISKGNKYNISTIWIFNEIDNNFIFLPTGEIVQVKDVIRIKNNFNNNNPFLSKYDIINRSKGYNSYIPDNLEKFNTYWNLYCGIKNTNNNVVLIDTSLSERIVPFDSLARLLLLLLLLLL